MELPTWCSFGSLQSLLLAKQVVHKPFPVMTLSRLLNVKKKIYIEEAVFSDGNARRRFPDRTQTYMERCIDKKKSFPFFYLMQRK